MHRRRFLTRSSGPEGIVTGPDGNIWFSAFSGLPAAQRSPGTPSPP